MKKLLMSLLAISLLTACSSKSQYSVKVTDNEQVLASNDHFKITKQGYFEYLLDRYGSNKVLDEALLQIANKEITDQSEINKLTKEREEKYAQYANGDLEQYAKSLGYQSKQDYISNRLIPDVKVDLLRKKYIKENLNTLLEEYSVCHFKKISVEKESTALNIIKKATSQEEFDKLMKDYSQTSEDAGLVTKNSTLDDNLKSKLSQLAKIKKDGVFSEAIKLSDNTYAVVYLYDTAHLNTDSYISSLSNDSNIQEDVQAKYLEKYNFTVNDNKIKEEIAKLSDKYIKSSK